MANAILSVQTIPLYLTIKLIIMKNHIITVQKWGVYYYIKIGLTLSQEKDPYI